MVDSFIPMATDLLARQITVNYDGGSLTMSQGNYIDLFGEDNTTIGAAGEPVTQGVKAHTRVRVIGGGTTNVQAHNREFIQWPSNSRDGAAGGQAVVMEWIGSQGPWQCRVTGPLWKLGTFLQSSSPKTVWFHAKGGKGYGPFKKLS